MGNGNILGVDRGTQYIGLAYRNEKSDMIMPIGYLMNDNNLFFNLGDVLGRYYIKQVVVGYPKQHEKTQKKIDAFIENILFVDDKIDIVKTDEEYTSVQSGNTTGDFKKNETEDTISAMYILAGFLGKELTN